MRKSEDYNDRLNDELIQTAASTTYPLESKETHIYDAFIIYSTVPSCRILNYCQYSDDFQYNCFQYDCFVRGILLRQSRLAHVVHVKKSNVIQSVI